MVAIRSVTSKFKRTAFIRFPESRVRQCTVTARSFYRRLRLLVIGCNTWGVTTARRDEMDIHSWGGLDSGNFSNPSHGSDHHPSAQNSNRYVVGGRVVVLQGRLMIATT